MNTIKVKKEVKLFCIMLISAVISAAGLHIFIYPTNFAPCGVDGIATVLQAVTGINAGIFNFAINLPLLVAAWFILKKRYVIYTIFYTLVTSGLLILFGELHVYQYVSERDMLLPAIFGGIAQGMTGLMLRIGASAGGIDVVACMLHKKFSHKNIENIIALLSYVIVVISYFVYWDLNSILLSVVEIFVCERVTEILLRDRRHGVKFEVVADERYLQEIKRAILYDLRHGATVMKGSGMFMGEKKNVIVCIVNYRQIPEFLEMISKFPDVFVYYSDILGIRGNFDWRKEEESEEDKRRREIRQSTEESQKEIAEAK